MGLKERSVNDLLSQALVLHEVRRFAEAEEIYNDILREYPDHADCLHLLGTALIQSGQREKVAQAVELLQRAIRLKPNRADYHVNLGVVLQDLKEYALAKEYYETAIKIDPSFADGYYNLGKLYKQVELPEAAVLNYKKLLSLDPKRQDALINMGNIYFDDGQLAKAIECFQTAIKVKLDSKKLNYRALINLANTFRKQGEDEKAIQTYEQALNDGFHDGLRIKQVTTLPVVYRDEEHIECVRKRFSAGLDNILKNNPVLVNPALEVSTTNFLLAYQAKLNRNLQEKTAQVMLKACPSLAFIAPHCEVSKVPKGKIKIGFLSAYFRRHSVGRLMQGLIAGISKNDFEVILFTPRGQSDETARAIQADCDKVVFFPDETEEAQQIVSKEKLDILFFADLGMDVRTYFLAFARLAPVQCVTWGHPDTTGIPNVDYFISSDLIETKGAANHYSETLYCLKSLPTKYYPVDIPANMKNRSDFGFSILNTLYLCPQSAIKYHPDLDIIFGEILRRDKKAVIVVVEGAVSDWTVQVRERWHQTLLDVENRISVVPRQSPEDFMGLQNVADVILDTPHFSGGNTSFEAFALGKPVVTHDGAFMRGRVTSGMYRMMDMDDCISDNLEDYINIALKLGTNISYRRKIAMKIQESRDLLFNNVSVVSEFEEFFKISITKIS